MSTVLRRALYGKLAGDTTLNGLLGTPADGYTRAIYYADAPDGAQYPLLIFTKQAGTPQPAFGKPSAYEEDVWLVKAIDRAASADTAEAIQARVAALLDNGTISISGEDLMMLWRTSDVEYPEVAHGERYHHAGSLYRIAHQLST